MRRRVTAPLRTRSPEVPSVTKYKLRVDGNGANVTKYYTVAYNGRTPAELAAGFNHTQSLSGLDPNTHYAFYLKAGNQPIGQTSSFVTGYGPESPGNGAWTDLSAPGPITLSASYVDEGNASMTVVMPDVADSNPDTYGLNIIQYSVQICETTESCNGNNPCNQAFDHTTTFADSPGETKLFIGLQADESLFTGIDATLYEPLEPQSGGARDQVKRRAQCLVPCPCR